MNKNLGLAAFARSFALRTGLSDKKAMNFCKEFVMLLHDELASGQGYTFSNLGSFVLKECEGGFFRSNLVGDDIYIPDHVKVTFKPAPQLRSKLEIKKR